MPAAFIRATPSFRIAVRKSSKASVSTASGGGIRDMSMKTNGAPISDYDRDRGARDGKIALQRIRHIISHNGHAELALCKRVRARAGIVHAHHLESRLPQITRDRYRHVESQQRRRSQRLA